MSRNTELTADPASSRIRTRSPEPFGRNVRRKITPPAISAERARRDAAVAQLAADTVACPYQSSKVKREETAAQRVEDILGDHAWRMDEDGDTALTHVVVDQPEHPMYERHLKHVRHKMCAAPFGGPLTSQPVPTLNSISFKEAHASEEKLRATKKLLTERWLARIVQHVGEAMEATDQDSMSVQSYVGRCRIEFKVVPFGDVENGELSGDGDKTVARDVETGSGSAEGNRTGDKNVRENDAAIDDSGIGLQTEDHPMAEDSDDVPLNRDTLARRNAVVESSANRTSYYSNVPSLAIERYMSFSHPSHRLLLRKSHSNTSTEPYRPLSRECIRLAIRFKMANLQIAKDLLSLREYCPDHWLIRFASEADAELLAGTTLQLRGAEWALEPFQNERWQIFVCNEVPKSIPYDQILKNVAKATNNFTSHARTNFYMMKSRRRTRRPQACMYLILDRPTDVKLFTIDCIPRVHFVAWLGDPICLVCKEEHHMLDCDRFVPLEACGGRRRPKTLLNQRPTIV